MRNIGISTSVLLPLRWAYNPTGEEGVAKFQYGVGIQLGKERLYAEQERERERERDNLGSPCGGNNQRSGRNGGLSQTVLSRAGKRSKGGEMGIGPSIYSIVEFLERPK